MDHLKSLKLVDYHHRLQGPLDGPLKSKKETPTLNNYLILGFCFLVFSFLLLPFLNAIIIAAIFYFAFIHAGEKYWKLPKRKKKFALVLGACTTVVIALTCYYAGVNLYHSSTELNQYLNYDYLFKKIQTSATELLAYFKATFQEFFPSIKINNDFIIEKINEGTVKVLSLLGVKVAQVFSSIPYLFLQTAVFILTFLTLKKLRNRKFENLENIIPENFGIDMSSIAKAFKESSYTTIVSTILIGLIQSVFITTGAVICEITAWPLVLMSSFIFSLIPLVGTLPVSFVVTAYLFSNASTTLGFIFIGFAVSAAIIDNVIRTILISNSKEELFGPVITFFSVIGGIYVLGFSGLFIAPFLIIFTQKLLKQTDSKSSTLSH